MAVRPPLKEEVAVEETVIFPEDKISPPDIFNPELEVIPPIDFTLIPPSNEEEAVPDT